MGDFLTPAALLALAVVVLIDITLSGDNAVVIGLATMGLPAGKRGRTLAFGVALATGMRVLLALVALPLLEIIGLTLAGGILLLWVVSKIWRELGYAHAMKVRAAGEGATSAPRPPPKSPRTAILQIAGADLAMSLDNVLAVAGAAREHPWVIAMGLALSVALMGLAASFVARLLARHRWLAHLGLVVIAAVALRMIWEGSGEVLGALLAP